MAQVRLLAKLAQLQAELLLELKVLLELLALRERLEPGLEHQEELETIRRLALGVQAVT